jgi:hypothetical protein
MPVPKESLLTAALEQPYPGLRAFEPHESFLFFGREAHTEELLLRLSRNRFLAVVGASGGGKSSLVRAGLLPALHRGHLVGSTSRWRIALMRPGGAPIEFLALALDEAFGPAGAARRTSLRATSLGLVHAARSAQLDPRESLLVVVDQFEELFRFAGENRQLEAEVDAAFFVSLLLQAVDQPEAPIYVVLTMRSDFLGDCARFAGLPEALNRGQYLIPRLSREQRQQAIERPLLLSGLGIAPRLVQQILNEAGEDPDQLPVLQHALLRTFKVWQRDGSKGGVDLSHYESAGGISRALDDHAGEVYSSLSEPDQRLAAKVFRCLTTSQAGRAVRRPASLGRLCAVVGAGDSEASERVAAIVRRFADREHSLLVCSDSEFAAETVIDISHESLIRKWNRLREWVDAEAKSADWYRDLARDVRRYFSQDAGLYRDPDLSRLVQRRDEDGWNKAWAAQYWPNAEPSFEETQQFLEQSAKAQQEELAREEARKRRELDDARRLAHANKRIALLIGLLFLLSAAGAAAFYYREWQNGQEIARITVEYKKTQDEQAEAVAKARSIEAQLDATRLELQTANVGDRKKLEAQLEKLKRAYADSATTAERARQDLKKLQSAPALQGSDHAELLKKTDYLQDQLAKVTQERDELRTSVETYQTVNVRDAGYWRSRADQAEAQLKAASRSMTELDRRAEAPVFVVLPQYSVLHVPGRTFANRLALCVGDVARSKSSKAEIWVWTSSGKEPLPEPFRDDEKRAKLLLGRLAGLECTASGDEGRWCFEVQKDQTISQTQRLGNFRLGGVPYSIVSTGWQMNAAGATDVISLTIYPAAQPLATTK